MQTHVEIRLLQLPRTSFLTKCSLEAIGMGEFFCKGSAKDLHLMYEKMAKDMSLGPLH